MNRTILYYPTIDIPNNNWLRHAVLYWDEVSSIVPKSDDDNILVELSPDIQYLMGEGQFRPIKPEDLIFNKKNIYALEDFLNEFEEKASSIQFKNFLSKSYRSKNFNFKNLHFDSLARIHNNKTTYQSLCFLEENGLAKKEIHGNWIWFEKHTALLYMSLLAKHLADIDSNHTTIGTDLVDYEKLNFRSVGESDGFPVVSFNLEKVLPTPKPNVPFEMIIDFKRKREHNLLHFKKQLSDFQLKISKAESQDDLKEIAINFQEDLRVGVKDLNAVLDDAKIQTGLKSFKSLINIKSPTFIAAGAISFLHLPVGILVGSGIAATAAIELSLSYLELRNQKRAKERDSPFSYIYQAKKTGILN